MNPRHKGHAVSITNTNLVLLFAETTTGCRARRMQCIKTTTGCRARRMQCINTPNGAMQSDCCYSYWYKY